MPNELKKPNIVYYLGAGASYDAIPIVNGIQYAMMNLYKVIEIRHKSGYGLGGKFEPQHFNGDLSPFDTENHSIIKFFYELYELGKTAAKYRTIDTLAFTYFLTYGKDSKEFLKLKLLLDCFFILWQNLPSDKINRVNTLEVNNNESEQNSNKQLFQFVDYRYLSLISSLLSNHNMNLYETSNETNNLEPNINFITWNYDLQVELALNLITPNRNLKSIVESLNENSKDSANIIRLNGNAGYIRDHLLIKKPTENDYYSIDMLKNQIFIVAEHYNYTFSKTAKDKEGSVTRIRFAFENTNYNKSVKHYENILRASELIKNAEHIIIIGYSFPTFNRKIDMALIENANKNTKFYIQNPSFTVEQFKEIFPQYKNQVASINPETFYIPPEYWGSKQESDWFTPISL